MSSGLFINLLDNNINDDQYKIENLYESPYFNCFTEDVFNDVYINLVKESGFYINKDIPWQIVANLRSPKIKFYFYNGFLGSIIECLRIRCCIEQQCR